MRQLKINHTPLCMQINKVSNNKKHIIPYLSVPAMSTLHYPPSVSTTVFLVLHQYPVPPFQYIPHYLCKVLLLEYVNTMIKDFCTTQSRKKR